MIPELRLDLLPEWEQIDEVRSACRAFLEEAGLERDVIDAVTMITCELTENATKYGHFAPADRIDVQVRIEPPAVTVAVKNPLALDAPQHLERLCAMIDWIHSHPDPRQAYLSRLDEVSRSADTRESGLGLVWVAYEGQSTLEAHVDEENALTVSAVYTLT